MQGARPTFVIIDEVRDWTMSVPETDDARLDRTNNFRIIDTPKGPEMSTPPDPGEIEYEDPARDYAEPEEPRAERYEPQFDETNEVQNDIEGRFWECVGAIKNWAADLNTDKLLGQGVLIALSIAVLRRRKKVKLEHHIYLHPAK